MSRSGARIWSAVFAVGVAGAAASASTTHVSWNSMSGWDRTPGANRPMFVQGPSPVGRGSLNMYTADGSVQRIFTNQFNGLRIGDIAGMDYSTFTNENSSRTDFAPAIVLNVAGGGLTRTLIFEPYYLSNVTAGEWQTWNAAANTPGQLGWWTPGGEHGSLRWEWLANGYQDWVITGFAFQVGGSSVWAGFDGNIDNFTLTTVDGTSRHFDFDPALAVIPLPMASAMGLAGLAGIATRRRRRERL